MCREEKRPCSARRAASHGALVSTVWPSDSSSPMEMIAACMGISRDCSRGHDQVVRIDGRGASVRGDLGPIDARIEGAHDLGEPPNTAVIIVSELPLWIVALRKPEGRVARLAAGLDCHARPAMDDEADPVHITRGMQAAALRPAEGDRLGGG